MNKSLLTFILILITSIVSANECVKIKDGSYDIQFPNDISELSINGDKIAYCAKFKVSATDFSNWLNGCNLTLESLPHGGEIYETTFTDGIVTVLDTGKKNTIYISVINTKDSKVFKNHIGVHRGCNL